MRSSELNANQAMAEHAQIRAHLMAMSGGRMFDSPGHYHYEAMRIRNRIAFKQRFLKAARDVFDASLFGLIIGGPAVGVVLVNWLIS